MPDDTEELVRQAYAALNRRDLDGFLARMDPDCEFVSLIAEAEGRDYRGHSGVREWWDQVAGSLGGISFEAQEIRSLDDGEAALIRVRVVGEAGGVQVEQEMWQAVGIRDGLAVWWQALRTEEEALEKIEERRGR